MYKESTLDDQIISSYGREQALADGVLIDVSYMARQAGIRYPVAVTSNLYESYINHGDKEGRLWDILWLFRLRAVHRETDELSFNVAFDADGKTKLVKLWATCSPGDLLEPVITIMLPEDY